MYICGIFYCRKNKMMAMNEIVTIRSATKTKWKVQLGRPAIPQIQAPRLTRHNRDRLAGRQSIINTRALGAEHSTSQSLLAA